MLATHYLAFEEQMTEPAAKLCSRWWGRGGPDVIAREVVAPGAIADIVGCAFQQQTVRQRAEHCYQPILEWAPLACVSVCGERPRTTAELAAAIGMSVSGARKAAALAVAYGALVRDGLVLSRNPDWMPPAKRLVAVELKLTDWRKALRQATTYCSWADQSWVVMARSISVGLRDAAAEVGVGVALLDGDVLRVVGRPARQRHNRFATARLLAGEQALAQLLVGATTPATATGRGAAQLAPAF